MGYCTKYTLKVKDSAKHQSEIEELAGYVGIFEESAKWYEHEKTMREHSLKYPDLLFTLQGEGDENWDVWVEYHKNGKMQKTTSTFVFDKFEEELLT